MHDVTLVILDKVSHKEAFTKLYNWKILYKHNTSLYKQNISLLYYYEIIEHD